MMNAQLILEKAQVIRAKDFAKASREAVIMMRADLREAIKL